MTTATLPSSADVLRIERSAMAAIVPGDDPTRRGRQSIALDLKSAGGREALLGLSEYADALIEGFRPGVMERLGIGPTTLGRAIPASSTAG